MDGICVKLLARLVREANAALRDAKALPSEAGETMAAELHLRAAIDELRRARLALEQKETTAA